MEKLKKFIREHKIFVFILIVIFYILFHIRKFYFIHNDSIKNFPELHLNELTNTDSVLDIAQSRIAFFKNDRIKFYVFSTRKFKTLTINTIRIIYDGKEKIFDYNIKYNAELNNSDFEKKLSFEYEGKNIQGYYKFFDYDYLTNIGKYCWINLYDLFKWKHGYLGAEFPVTIIVNYKLDDRKYTQELNYTITCEKDWPSTWFNSIFCKSFIKIFMHFLIIF